MPRSVHPHPHMSSGAGDPPALARIPQTRARAQTDALSIPHSLPFDNPATETGPPNLIHSTATRHSAQKTSNMASKLQNSLSADPSATRLPLGLGLGVLGPWVILSLLSTTQRAPCAGFVHNHIHMS